MNKKQIDLDAMRTLAREFRTLSRYARKDRNLLDPTEQNCLAAADNLEDLATEIEQLRKNCVDYAETKKRDMESYVAMDAGIRALEATVEQLRKERDALWEALRFYADFDCTHHPGTIARAALAAQGDKPA